MTAKKSKLKVAVCDMQPITPAVGGGRLHLLGLFHNLGEDVECNYVGTYDWEGEKFKRNQLTACLSETIVPLSKAHFQENERIKQALNGKNVIDLTFSKLGSLSKEYLDEIISVVDQSEVVAFSHPWVYPLVRDYLSPRKMVIYDSHNVEGFLRAILLDSKDELENNILNQVVLDEYQLGLRADLILACSHEDMLRFNRIYDFPFQKMRVVPNGAMAFQGQYDHVDKTQAREKLGLDKNQLIVLFIGSDWPPNVEGAEFIINELAPKLPYMLFAILGGVGDRVDSNLKNVVITGFIDEDTKSYWLRSADIAVNPMFSGSGTNIKMFDYMVASLPIVSSLVGARGIETGKRKAFLEVKPCGEDFIAALKTLENEKERFSLGKSGRQCVEDSYSWERISALLGTKLWHQAKLWPQSMPLFSIIVPTYERHAQLAKLIKTLQDQAEHDFELIIVDQSKESWKAAHEDYGFPFLYYHSPVKGAIRARNAGAFLSCGKILAFTDDDCLPERDWLLNARKYFHDPKVVGLEGRIYSDHMGDPDWRTVSNDGMEGIGFMTANMFIRSGVFQKLGGFDLQFDEPHFREDTDMGWRLQEEGEVPYARDVAVFHPAHPRLEERESLIERAKFFVNDARLYQKHPEKFKALFKYEGHYLGTEGYAYYLKKGFADIGMNLPEWMQSDIAKIKT